MGIEVLRHIYFRTPIIIRLLLTILVVMFLFGTIIHFIEPDQFPTIFDGIWWSFVTGATVGYGDYAPISKTGRIIGIVLMLSGAGLITYYISYFAASTIKYEKDLSKGIVTYKGTNHLICIGWNERTRSLIEMTLHVHPQKEIVLIDQSLTHLSYQNFPIHFIHGDATEDKTLERANLKNADAVIITADMSKAEQQTDKYTILSTVAIRGNNEEIPIIAEIVAKRQIKNAKRAGASTIVRPNDFLSRLLFHELFSVQHSTPFEAMLALLTEQQFIQIPLPTDFVNQSFITTFNHFLEEKFLIIGVIRDSKWHINPGSNFKLGGDDFLIGLQRWEKE